MSPLPLKERKMSALGNFDLAMKQPTLASYHFKILSNGKGKLSQRENIDACQPSIPFAHGPKKMLYCFILMKLLIKIGVGNYCTSISFFVHPT